MPKQHGGGSVGQSLRYMDTAAPEQSAPAGRDLLIERGHVVRPAIGGGTRKRGGFFPSVMSGVVNAGMLTLPLAGYSARKLLSRKTRKGGAKMAKWLAQKEEAKAMLQAYGKPSARNIQGYAMARRRGTNIAEEFLSNFRKRKQEKEEANEARRIAKELAKAQKKRERNEKRAASKKNKTVKKPRASKKAKVVGKHLFFNNEGQVINSAARNKALESLGKKVASPKTPTMNRPKTPVNNRPKTPVNNRPKTPVNNRPKTPVNNTTAKKGKKGKAKKANNGTVKTRKSPSAASKKYFEELRKAREYLGSIGHPLGPNMSKFASMKLKGENTKAWEENFKTRRPLSLATAKKPRKTKTVKAKENAPRPASPKPLTAVKEENENNENEMQGYSENFEPETESGEK